MKPYPFVRRVLAGLAAASLSFACASGLFLGPVAALAQPGELPVQDKASDPRPQVLPGAADRGGGERPDVLPNPRPVPNGAQVPASPSILPPTLSPIDLPSALNLAGVANPDLLIARQRVAEANAIKLLACAQILPNLNAGMNYDNHTGVLQQSSGNILNLDRGAFNVGMGVGATAAGTQTIPGLYYNFNLSQAFFSFLESRQLVQQRQFDSIAVRNDILLQVATAYVELLRAEGLRAIALLNRNEAREIYELVDANVAVGRAKPSDRDRMFTELQRRNDLVLAAESQVLTAGARLAQLLNLDPSSPLYAVEDKVVPGQIVPDPAPLAKLVFVATQQRPELAAQAAAIRQAALALHAAKVLPFSPNVLIGFSTDDFGGGSNLVAQPGGFDGSAQSRFGSFAGRTDTDVFMYWTAQNMGVGNIAQIRLARSQLRIADLEQLRILNMVRAQVATAYARSHARYAQIDVAERAVRVGERAYDEDKKLVKSGGVQILPGLAPPEKGGGGARRGARTALPVELLDSYRLMADARDKYLNAISDYNAAEFELYVALGQPPAATLARLIPPALLPPPAPAGPSPGGPGCAPAVPAPVAAAAVPASR
jgi:outer membrane protein TolC